ncbi:putative dCMP deaminase [Dioszegia hungarica]|uniref:Deoxycytidylate deaminase n=1 Tax=Dioszegia hungarica TaxID=4972 RepID=A0AA38HD97_9TREE|nr:putative dCMP deaminase [Dioszegia hungarica]KAI9638560.1 putative dCMP deaminase [Dioszegia hungarica]
MFIAIIGTPSAGKRTLLDYLVSKHGFTQIGLEAPSDPMDAARPTFASPAILLDYVTHNWLINTVTTDLRTYDEIEPFLKRPFFLLVSVDGPLRTRFERERERSKNSGSTLTLDDFIAEHDTLLNGPPLPTSLPPSTFAHHPQTDFSRVMKLANVSVCNNLPSVPALWAYLDQLNLMDEERLRPGWDTYFMTLASLASHRSNCMKRRVGALLVRSKRILSTGYNGTPRGIRNCNQGGCRRCNGTARGGESLDECLCLHAEENALLEAGRERIGDDSVIYCNTCPCLRCSVKIVQTGVREVVYNQSYSMDAASAMVLKEGGVILRQLHMPP